jgi:hypothetical protein
MHNPTRFVLIGGIVVAFLGGIAAGVSSVDPAALDEFRNEELLGIQLDVDLRIIARHMHMKERIIDALVAEKMSLLEAAACFQHVDKERRRPYPRAEWKVTSDEEYYCRQVLRYVESRAPACAGRFQEELRDLLLQNNIRFPTDYETAQRLDSMNQ